MNGEGDILVAQLGARMHYAVPRLLARAGRLQVLYTDFYARSFPWMSHMPRSIATLLPASFRRAMARDVPGVAPKCVRAANWLGLSYAARLRLAQDEKAYLEVVMKFGRRFGEFVAAQRWRGVRATYSFNGAGLEILRKSRACGIFGILEQTIAPKRIEEDLLAQVRREFPTWAAGARPDRQLNAHVAREEQEWREARLIVCASEFVARHVATIAGSATAIAVIPYGVDLPNIRRDEGTALSGPLRVVSVGAQGLRKGTPYVLAAARQLIGAAVFRLVGDARGIPSGERVPDNVTVLGSVPRPEILGHLQWADAFLLPSICEGSATATYEALAAGLPIVCTPNSGSVVRDGIEGTIVPPFSTDAIVAAIAELKRAPDLRAEMSRNATRRAAEHSVAAYGERLLNALDEHVC